MRRVTSNQFANNAMWKFADMISNKLILLVITILLAQSSRELSRISDKYPVIFNGVELFHKSIVSASNSSHSEVSDPRDKAWRNRCMVT